MPDTTRTSNLPSPLRAFAAVAACGVLLVGCSEPGNGGGSSPSMQTPAFAYEPDRITVISTATPSQPKQPPPALQREAARVADSMALLMKASFLDPANWSSGSYDSALDFYDKDAATAAQEHLAVLTAGPDAGRRFTNLQPETGHLNVKFLVDEQDRPIMTVAIAEFVGTATEADGGTVTIVSRGQYFLNKVGKNYVVYAFDVTRQDQGARPKSATSTPQKETTTP